jgi:hypothetical protein
MVAVFVRHQHSLQLRQVNADFMQAVSDYSYAKTCVDQQFCAPTRARLDQ